MTGRLDSEVIIIGGGATGAGIARDCARRGLRTLLIERHDIATGATGRNHGLLHSGARYAVTDNESARECISENRILRRIARHCIEPSGGLFITLPEDDLAYQQTLSPPASRPALRPRCSRRRTRCAGSPPSTRRCWARCRSRTVPSTRFASPRPICSTPANTARRSLPAAK